MSTFRTQVFVSFFIIAITASSQNTPLGREGRVPLRATFASEAFSLRMASGNPVLSGSSHWISFRTVSQYLPLLNRHRSPLTLKEIDQLLRIYKSSLMKDPKHVVSHTQAAREAGLNRDRVVLGWPQVKPKLLAELPSLHMDALPPITSEEKMQFAAGFIVKELRAGASEVPDQWEIAEAGGFAQSFVSIHRKEIGDLAKKMLGLSKRSAPLVQVVATWRDQTASDRLKQVHTKHRDRPQKIPRWLSEKQSALVTYLQDLFRKEPLRNRFPPVSVMATAINEGEDTIVQWLPIIRVKVLSGTRRQLRIKLTQAIKASYDLGLGSAIQKRNSSDSLYRVEDVLFMEDMLGHLIEELVLYLAAFERALESDPMLPNSFQNAYDVLCFGHRGWIVTHSLDRIADWFSNLTIPLGKRFIYGHWREMFSSYKRFLKEMHNRRDAMASLGAALERLRERGIVAIEHLDQHVEHPLLARYLRQAEQRAA